jgi:hypothetical protein
MGMFEYSSENERHYWWWVMFALFLSFVLGAATFAGVWKMSQDIGLASSMALKWFFLSFVVACPLFLGGRYLGNKYLTWREKKTGKKTTPIKSKYTPEDYGRMCFHCAFGFTGYFLAKIFWDSVLGVGLGAGIGVYVGGALANFYYRKKRH